MKRLIAISVLVLVGCDELPTRRNEAFCCTTQPGCEDAGVDAVLLCHPASGRTYCDGAGDYGPRNTCIEEPVDAGTEALR